MKAKQAVSANPSNPLHHNRSRSASHTALDIASFRVCYLVPNASHLLTWSLCQNFPKSTYMSILTQDELDQAAHSLNGRPRQTLEWMTPSEKLAQVLQ